jgi:DNA-directed RNA polymerase specialized sigma24 family protein
MASNIQEAKLTGIASSASTVAPASLATYQRIYDKNRHRLYSLAFWMTDNELAAAELLETVFRRAFARSAEPDPEFLDRTLINEIRELMPLGTLTLDQPACREVASVRRNVLRVHLECAVVQLPPTERMIFLMHDVENYDHARIARNLGLSEQESQFGLHQARLRLRELLASMN